MVALTSLSLNSGEACEERLSKILTSRKKVKTRIWHKSPMTIQSKSNPITGLDRPSVVQEVEVPRFQDSRHMMVVRLSALRTGRFYP